MIASLLSLLISSLNVVRADSRLLEIEEGAGLASPPVPRDRLLAPRFSFRAPMFQQVRDAFLAAHAVSEVFYSGGGVWDCPGEFRSEVRHTSNRVLGYIRACRALGDEAFRARAVEGLDYLLEVQAADGDIPWFHRSYRGIRNREDGLFETGIAGRAFVEGFQLTGSERFLEASARAAEWEIGCPISPNNNYNMFAVWHLAGHYAVTGDARFLQAAIEKTRLGGFPGQLPSGGWPRHNSWIWYHGIIVRGMAELARVLPEGHPFGPELKGSLTAAINRALAEQLRSGEVPPNPGVRIRGHTCPFILNGLLTARPLFGDCLDACLHGIMQFRLRRTPDPELVRSLAEIWSAYVAGRDAARRAATGETVWRADFSRFVDDPLWGRKTPDTFCCWYPCNDPDPACHRWEIGLSERTGAACQRITVSGRPLLGGMGWNVPADALVSGRRYRFTARVRCSGEPERVSLVLCSAYAGKNRPDWDPFTGCEFTRENPSFGEFSEVSTTFVASKNTNRVFVWLMCRDLSPGTSVSFEVDEAVITDAGEPLPRWKNPLERIENQTDMILLPTGHYLEEMFPSPRQRQASR